MTRTRLWQGLIAALLLCSAARLWAQQPAADEGTPVIRATTRLVLVDTLVTDKSGKPIAGLKADDFTVEENGKKQKLAVFEMRRPVTPAPTAQLPPNIYSNRPMPEAGDSSLVILLVDGLNTQFKDQTYARQQLLKYVHGQLVPNQRIAVFALGMSLTRLQDFTSDPTALRDAIGSIQSVDLAVTARSTPQNVSGLAQMQSQGTGYDVRGGADANLAMTHGALISSLQQFEVDQARPVLEQRIYLTLAALRQLARMVAGHPGRKNLIWVSSGFPVSLVPEDVSITYTPQRDIANISAPPPLPNENSFGAYSQQLRQASLEDVKRTAALVADAQVAIYPVDARGLLSGGLSAGSVGTQDKIVYGQDFGVQVSSASDAALASQGTMEDLAKQTGGLVFKNRNDIDHGVAAAASDGGTYYQLGYYPEKKKFDGSFHKVKVSCSQAGAQVRHREGYFAVDPTKLSAKEKDLELSNAMRAGGDATLVLFDAQVVPPSPVSDKNQVPVKFLVRPSSFSLDDAGGGKKKVSLDFFAVAVGADGKTAGQAGKTVDTVLDEQQSAGVQQGGLLMPMDIALPPGSYSLHLAVRDNRTGAIGTLIAPLLLKR